MLRCVLLKTKTFLVYKKKIVFLRGENCKMQKVSRRCLTCSLQKKSPFQIFLIKLKNPGFSFWRWVYCNKKKYICQLIKTDKDHYLGTGQLLLNWPWQRDVQNIVSAFYSLPNFFTFEYKRAGETWIRYQSTFLTSPLANNTWPNLIMKFLAALLLGKLSCFC